MSFDDSAEWQDLQRRFDNSLGALSLLVKGLIEGVMYERDLGDRMAELVWQMPDSAERTKVLTDYHNAREYRQDRNG